MQLDNSVPNSTNSENYYNTSTNTDLEKQIHTSKLNCNKPTQNYTPPSNQTIVQVPVLTNNNTFKRIR